MAPQPDLTALIRGLGDADPGVRRRAAERLAGSRDAATAALEELTLALDDDDAEVRLAAVNTIASADAIAAEGAMSWALESPDYRVAVAARTFVQGTARLRGPDATLWRDPSIGRSE